MPTDEVSKLQTISEKVHAQRRRLRFWGAPDNEASWEQQARNGVDLINTDKLTELSRFLGERK